MDKPISVIVEETRTKLVEIINESSLPPFVIEPILKDLYNEVKYAKQKQYEIDIKKYQNSIKNESDEETENSTV